MKNKFTPICFFTYNRLKETKNAINALQNNFLAKYSDLFIFSDGYDNNSQKYKVERVRKYIKTIKGFNSITIFESPINKGLANSIINGVSKVINKYNKVIVLEDDLITSPNFLNWMNQGLEFYEDDLSIHSISGYTMDLKSLKKYSLDYYLSYRSSSWGWGTWKDRWLNVDWEVKEYKVFKYNIKSNIKFMRGGSDLPMMLKSQMDGKLDSWAIRWCFNQFSNNQFSIFPSYSKVVSIGFGRNATNTKFSDKFNTNLDKGDKTSFKFDKNYEKNIKIINEFAEKFSFKNRSFYKIKEHMIKLWPKIKYFIKVMLRKEIIVSKQIELETSWFGNKHAGFFVYTKLLNSNSIVYSFGVGNDISFDNELINDYNCKVYAFDPTPKSIDYISSNKPSSNFFFKPYGLNNKDGDVTFYLPSNPKHISGTTTKNTENNQTTSKCIDVPMKKFETIIKELGHKKIDIVKLDIEGSEYDVIDDILQSKVEINQILIEFHHRFSSISLNKTTDAIKKLNKSGYKIAAISDQYEEYTFIKERNL